MKKSIFDKAKEISELFDDQDRTIAITISCNGVNIQLLEKIKSFDLKIKRTANVLIMHVGNNKLAVVKTVKEIMDSTLKEAKDLVDLAPSGDMVNPDYTGLIIGVSIEEEKALRIAKTLEEMGAKVKIDWN